MEEVIREVSLDKIDKKDFDCHFADAIVLTQDNRILLQERPVSWGRSPGYLTAFGGHIEENETVLEGLTRELKEELGAKVSEVDILPLGAITESFTEHAELIHVHFWHDQEGTITGCYECKPVYYKNVTEALKHPKIMDYVVWALHKCQEKGLLQ